MSNENIDYHDLIIMCVTASLLSVACILCSNRSNQSYILYPKTQQFHSVRDSKISVLRKRRDLTILYGMAFLVLIIQTILTFMSSPVFHPAYICKYIACSDGVASFKEGFPFISEHKFDWEAMLRLILAEGNLYNTLSFARSRASNSSLFTSMVTVSEMDAFSVMEKQQVIAEMSLLSFLSKSSKRSTHCLYYSDSVDPAVRILQLILYVGILKSASTHCAGSAE